MLAKTHPSSCVEQIFLLCAPIMSGAMSEQKHTQHQQLIEIKVFVHKYRE